MPGPEPAGTPLVGLAVAAVVAVLAGNLAPPAPGFGLPLLALALAAGWRGLVGSGRRLGWWAAFGALLGLTACALAPRWPASTGRQTLPVRFTVAIRDGWTSGPRGWGTRVRVEALESGGRQRRAPGELDMYITAPVGLARLPRAGTRWQGSGDLVRTRSLPLVAGYLRVKTLVLLHQLPGRSAVDAVRDRAVSALQRGAGTDTGRLRAAGLAAALVLERREALQAGEVASMRRSGLVHLLSVSGLHVGLVGVLAWGAFTLVGVRPGVRRWLVVAVLLAFAMLAGGNAPVRRATAAGVAYLAARQFGRPLEPLPTVWAIVAGLVILEPPVLLQPGFELSAFVTLALVRWMAPVAALLRFLPLRVGQTVAVALVAQAASAPLVGGYFATLPPLGVVANLLVAPLELLLVGASLLAVAAAAVSPLLGGWALVAVGGGQWLLDAGSSAGAVLSWPFPPWSAALAAATAVLGLAALTRARVSGAAAAVAVGITVAWLAAPSLPRPVPHAARMLDVGEGMAILLQSGRAAVLVDAGRAPFDAWRELAGARVRRLDALVITHPDADHTGGAAILLERLRVGSVCYPRALGGRAEILGLRRLARRSGVEEIPLEKGSRVSLAGVDCRVLWPPPVVAGLDNDASLVARLKIGNLGVLITGDLEAPGERQLLASREELGAAVLQLPHHGSRTSSTSEFLLAVRPVVAVAATGARPRFPYPDREVVRRVLAVPAVLFAQGPEVGRLAWEDGGCLLLGRRGEVRVSRAPGARRD